MFFVPALMNLSEHWGVKMIAPITQIQKKRVVDMEKRKTIKNQIKLIFLVTVIFLFMSSAIYAGTEDSVKMSIYTTLDEAVEVSKILEKRGYDLVSKGDLDIEASFNANVRESKGLWTSLLDNLKFVVPGVVGLIIAVLVIIAKNHQKEPIADEEGNYMSLTERLGYQRPNQNPYYSYYQDNADIYSNDPMIIQKRDYSGYSDNGQSNLIRQKTMYYK